MASARTSGSALQYGHELQKAYLAAWGGKRADAKGSGEGGGIVTTDEPDGGLGVYMSGLVGGDFLATDYATLVSQRAGATGCVVH